MQSLAYPTKYISEAVLIVGFDGFIRMASDEIVHFVGYQPGEVVGLPLNYFAAEHVRKIITNQWFELCAAYLNTPQHTETRTLQTQALHRDGHVLPVKLRLTPVMERREFMVLLEIERESVVQAQVAALETVIKAVSSLDIHEVLELILSHTAKLIHSNAAILMATRKDGYYLIDQNQPNGPTFDIEDLTEAPATTVLRETHHPLLISDCTIDPRCPYYGLVESGSWLGIPLVYHHEFMGFMWFYAAAPQAFSLADADIASSFAEEAAVAVYNAALHLEAQERTQRLSAMSEVALAISRRNLDEIMEIVYREVSALMDASFFYIGLYNAHRNTITLKHVYDNDERIADIELDLSESQSISTWVITHRQPLVIGDISRDPLPSQVFYYGSPVKHVVCFPLLVQAEIVGIISVQSHQPDHFTEQDVAVLEAIASATAIAIRNTQLFEDMQRRLREVSGLQTLAQTITNTQDIGTISSTVVERLYAILGCTGIALALFNENQWRIQATCGTVGFEQWPFPYSDAPIYLANTADEIGGIDNSIRSILVVPMGQHGAICITKDAEQAFTADHERVLMLAASQAAATIENACLLQEAQHQASELQELDQLRLEVVQNVSHDLRSPLALVQGYMHLMREETFGPITPKQIDAIAIVERKASSMLSLVEDILEVEPISADILQKRPIDLVAMLRQTIEGMQLVYPDHIFEMVTTEAELVTELDQARIDRVLDNLISNAVKFSPSGKRIIVHGLQHQQWARIVVQDEGQGIAVDKVHRVFERFYRVPGTGKRGIGLGLAIVKQIVEAHGGRVHVESQVGKGSTFVFDLPL
ncbi:MAG: GAF domain-containing protein [Anaerolineales bacterium]|nr:GAF domain-containing protein [Anaerolineales bacterium]